MRTVFQLLAVVATAAVSLMSADGLRAQLLITGNDEKVSFDENGKRVVHPPGKDTVSIIDISERTKPKIVANLPLMNTIVGPPVNLAITRDQRLALVANSLDWIQDGASWKEAPDNKIYVIDLTVSPPAQIATIEAGKQPSGMAINQEGTLALVANRADDTVSVLKLDGKKVTLAGSVSLAGAPTTPGGTVSPVGPSAVAITPDGKHALVVKTSANRVALLDIDGDKVTYAQIDGKNYDMTTGLTPLNVQITPDGKLAIVNNIGGSQDGNVDTVGITDLEAKPPRVIDQVVVGDAPEGLAMSPAGGYAASLLLNGSGGTPKTAFYWHEHSLVALLKITGKSVSKVSEIPVGGLAEGIAFSPDGGFLYVGNFIEGNIDILRLDGDRLAKVSSFALQGHPASMRGSTP
jgi:DNA-binding beta-propeller fold protein YncE